MAKNRLCDECIAQLIQGLSQDEIYLIVVMNKKKLINPQLSYNEKELLELINSNKKKITIYNLRKMIYRLTAVQFIAGNKFGTLKYYLTTSGIRAVSIYNAFVNYQMNMIKDNTSSIKEDNIESINQIKGKKRNGRKDGRKDNNKEKG